MITRRLTFALVLAAAMLALAAGLRYAETVGWLTGDAARRAMQVLIGLGLALGLAIIVGLAAMFGAGGAVTSLVGFATTRKPQVGWRIFSMWMHAGFMLMAGAGIGGFIVPMIWPVLASFTEDIDDGRIVTISAAHIGRATSPRDIMGWPKAVT